MADRERCPRQAGIVSGAVPHSIERAFRASALLLVPVPSVCSAKQNPLFSSHWLLTEAAA